MKGVKSRELEHELAAVFCEGECCTDCGGDRNRGKPTAEANKRVPEVLERQWLGQSTWATVHSEEARAKTTQYYKLT